MAYKNGFKKKDPSICCLQETHFRSKDTFRLKVKCGNFLSCKRTSKESWSSNTYIKLVFKTKIIKRNKGHYIIINGAIKQEDIIIINIYAPTWEHTQIYKTMTKIKEPIGNNTIIVWEFNTPLTTIDRLFKQKSTRKQWFRVTHWTRWT